MNKKPPFSKVITNSSGVFTTGLTLYEWDPSITGYNFFAMTNFSEPIKRLAEYYIGSNYVNATICLCQSADVSDIKIEPDTIEGLVSYNFPIKKTVDWNSLEVSFIDTQERLLTNFINAWFDLLKPLPVKNATVNKSPVRHSDLIKLDKNGNMYALYACSGLIFSTNPSLTKVTQSVGLIGLFPISSCYSTGLNFERSSGMSLYNVKVTFNLVQPVYDHELDSLIEEQLLPHLWESEISGTDLEKE